MCPWLHAGVKSAIAICCLTVIKLHLREKTPAWYYDTTQCIVPDFNEPKSLRVKCRAQMESQLKPAVRWKCWGGVQNENLRLWHAINTRTFNAQDCRWKHFSCSIWYTLHAICFRKGHTLTVTPIFLLFHILSPMDYFVFNKGAFLLTRTFFFP